MHPTGQHRDPAVTQALAWVALVLVIAWCVAAFVVAVVRLVVALHVGRAEVGVLVPGVPVTVLLLLTLLSMAAFASLVLGVAVGVVALLRSGDPLRCALLGVLAVLGVVGQGLASGLALADVAAPVVDLVAALVLFRPLLRVRRSTPVPAAVG